MTIQAKWDKGKDIVKTLLDVFEEKDNKDILFDHKYMKKGCGFLVHLATTYDWMKPFFKGTYLTLEKWWGNRRSYGWKYNASEWSMLIDNISHGRKDDTSRDVLEKEYLEEHQGK